MNMEYIKSIAKAIAAGLGAGAAYLMGVVPAEGTFSDVSLVQWLGLVPVILATYGITWRVPNVPVEEV